MKSAKALVSTAILLALSSFAQAEKLPPGEVDFGTFEPSSSGKEFVEVNVTGTLIAMASKFVEKEDADVAKVLNGLHSVHVNVIGIDDSNRAGIMERAQKIRKELDSKGWERIVTVQQQNQDVSVFLKSRNKEAIEGLVAVVLDGNSQAVFVNVVGDIRPEQLSMLSEKFHIEPLKKIAEATQK